MRLHPIKSPDDIRLGDDDARLRGRKVPSGHDLERETQKQVERIAEFQRVLYADRQHALLIVLQGRDASGKDGTIRKVFSAVNPQGCAVSSFGVPTELEKRHDFLWRVHLQIPARGLIGIFNRSHYEDILVPHTRGELGGKDLERRYQDINAFERMLVRSGVTILKFMLHVSRDEQRKRLQERIDDPSKNWKFRAGDLEDRGRWEAFDEAYQGILEHTSTRHARWYLVPADDKDVRDWLIARVIADALDKLGLEYPKAEESIAGLVVK